MIGKGGLLEGNLYTQDAVIAGRVLGAVYAESHLELQATSEISGEIQARRMHVEDGAALQGQVAGGATFPPLRIPPKGPGDSAICGTWACSLPARPSTGGAGPCSWPPARRC